MKAGFAWAESPAASFPSVVSRAKGGYYGVGDERMGVRGMVSYGCARANGAVRDWEDVEKLWNYMFFQELRVDPEECACLFTEGVDHERRDRERLVQLLLETFNVPHLYVSTPAPLALYATGRTTGLVVDSGFNWSTTAAVVDGYAAPESILRTELAGKHVTDWILREVNRKGHYLGRNERKNGESIKERLCVVGDIDEGGKQHSGNWQRHCKLPDGSVISLEQREVLSPEMLFQPKMYGKHEESIQDISIKSIYRCNLSVQEELSASIVLTGGNSLFGGFKERMEAEIQRKLRSERSAAVLARGDRQTLAWKGGALLCSLSSFLALSITKEDYDEYGPQIIHRKCVM